MRPMVPVGGFAQAIRKRARLREFFGSARSHRPARYRPKRPSPECAEAWARPSEPVAAARSARHAKTVVKRLRDGRRAKAAEGKHAVRPYAFGYEGTGKGRERDAGPRADEQHAVARIVAMRAAGEPYRTIAAALDAEGLRPRKAQRWSAAAVRNVALRASAS